MVWDVLGGVAVVILVLAVAFLLRLRRLAGRVGAFELALRRTGQRGWASGIGIFGDDDVEWYRLVSLGWRPRLRFHRPDIELGELRTHSVQKRKIAVEYRSLVFRQLHLRQPRHSRLFPKSPDWRLDCSMNHKALTTSLKTSFWACFADGRPIEATQVFGPIWPRSRSIGAAASIAGVGSVLNQSP